MKNPFTFLVDSFVNGFEVLFETIKVLIKKPYLILPIFVSWIFYALIILYFVYYFNWNQLTLKQGLFLFFIVVFVICFIFSISSFILLELIEQIETGQKISFIKAFYETFVKDLPRALPIMFVWAFIWFTITLIEAMLSKKNNNNNRQPSYENFAKTLGGYQKFSLFGLTLDLINSGVRLVVFFIYPAIAWEDEGPINSVKKGFYTIKSNPGEFIGGFTMIEGLIVLVGIPAAIIFELSKEGVAISDPVWIATIIYMGLATSFYFYVQQMFAAILYMWNMRWIKAVEKAQEENNPIMPRLDDVKMPDLLDDIPDLIVR